MVGPPIAIIVITITCMVGIILIYAYSASIDEAINRIVKSSYGEFLAWTLIIYAFLGAYFYGRRI